MLSGFAIAQPLLGITATAPTSSCSAGPTGSTSCLVLGVLLPALFWWALEVAVGLVSDTVGASCTWPPSARLFTLLAIEVARS